MATILLEGFAIMQLLKITPPGSRVSDLLTLIRAPAALSVPGDVLAGAAAVARWRFGPWG